jgi:hypothetical protein
MRFPVLLRGGLRLFGETSDKQAVRLVSSKALGDVLILIYQPTGVE